MSKPRKPKTAVKVSALKVQVGPTPSKPGSRLKGAKPKTGPSNPKET